MDDDQLRNALDRRSRGAQFRAEELLPSVRRGIGARPQPARIARWAPLAGLAAAAVIVVALVIVFPGGAPSAGSQTLDVMTTQAFASALQSGSLDNKTVLVTGGIVPFDASIAGAPCLPPGLCALGQLENVQPSVPVIADQVAVASSDSSSLTQRSGWPWWTDFNLPVRGTLVLSVDGAGGVEYLGRGVLNGDQLPWSAGEVQTQLDVNAQDLGDVVLVSGWLTGVMIPSSCAAALPTMFPGLPDRNECGVDSWIADEPAVLTAQSEQPLSAIEVQPPAFATYAPDATARSGDSLLPQRAVYAVARRLYGQFCVKASPCWDWSVVGRLSQAAPVVPPSVAQRQTPAVQPTPTADTQTTTPPPTPNTVSCTGDVTLTDTTGQVLACSDAGGRDYHSQDAHISVDPALPSRLNIWWGQSTCAVSYEINVSAAPADLPQPADYQIEVLSQNGPSSDCMPDAHAASIDFGSPVDATRVRLVINDQRLADPVACVPAPGLVDRGDGVNIYDSTDLITSCTQRQPTTDSAELVSNLTESSIVVRWKDRPCGVPIHLMFDSVSRSNGSVLSKPGQCMVTSLMTYEIVVNFTQSISASSIDASSLPSSN